MRQFDVLVWGPQTDSDKPQKPPFTDNALGWFFGNDLNASLAKSDAEWIVFAHESVAIDRAFLNSLAECISGFPMVDAFAPRIHDKASNKFLSGYALDKRSGLSMLDENASMRFVAVPHPYIAVFSRRILQRTGAPDPLLHSVYQIADLSLRMLHAGGKMFSVPYLVCNANEGFESSPYSEKSARNELAFTLYKAFGFWHNASFLVRNAGAIPHLWANRKPLSEKRKNAILLSKLTKDFLAGLY
ncbi:MAG: hypothetical protein IKZ45_08415 [Fibrobacter sp.]|jgi:hypothetical protein|nr:hypothetical protein [Fibrobacter sp.]